MIFLTKVVCVFGALVIVNSQQLSDKYEEALCKLQCVNEVDSPCSSTKKDCECGRNLILNLDLINMTRYGRSVPKLKCKAEDMFLVEWDHDVNPFRPSNYTAYFLHVKTPKEDFFTNVTFCNYFSIGGINPNTSFSITLWGVDDGFEIFASKPLNITSNEIDTIPLPVSNISVDLEFDTKKYEANVKWAPAADLSCYYEIILYCINTSNTNDVVPAPETFEVAPPSELFTLHIEELNFGYTYDLIIRSRGAEMENESEGRNFSIYIPTCIETFKNLTICVPEQPQGLKVTESPDVDEYTANVYDIHIHWLRPALTPDCYIAKLNIFNNTRHVQGTPNLTIPGDANSATFKKIDLSSYYQVHLQAISAKGRSIAAIENRFLKTPTGFLPSMPQDRADSFNTLLIIVGILSVVLVFGLLTIPLRKQRLNRINSKKENKYEEDRDIKQVPCTTDSQYVKESDKWEMSIESLNFKTVIGEGAFGIVWHAMFGQTPVACKTLKEKSTADEIRQLQQEIEIMKYVGSHPNIVSMVGYITENVSNGPILIVEYCSNGDLLSYLRTIYDHMTKQLNKLQENGIEEGSNDFTNKLYELDMNHDANHLFLSQIDVISFGRQIALGMEYLSNQKVLHRDLAARNILMCDDKRVKVSDFGLSRDVYMDRVYCKTTGGKLPIRWMALESLTHQIYTSQSDVWSFGILMWEIVSFGSIPYPGVDSHELLGILKRGERMPRPHFCPSNIYSIMRDCWKESPNDRPTFCSLRESFEALLTNEIDYLELSTG